MKKYMIAFFALALIYCYYGCKCKELDVPRAIRNVKPTIKVLGEDIVYTERQVYDLKLQQYVTVQLKMDIVCHKDDRADAAPRPLVIFFHGYNPITYFNHSAETYKYYKQDAHQQLMLEFAGKHHCVVALVDYIPTELKWENIAVGFAKKEDCKNGNSSYTPLLDTLEEKRNNYFMARQGKDAVRYLKSKHNEYNVDINNITLIGFSAGGIVASGAGLINAPALKPAYTQQLSAVAYDANNPYPNEVVNLLRPLIQLATCRSFTEMPNKFTNAVPRSDLGNIEGSNTTTYNSSVKNVALLCTGLSSSISLNSNGPRLFVFGHDNDPELQKLRKEAAVNCSNKKPFYIFNEIKTKAITAGYVENINLKVIQSNTSEHNYNANGTLAGSYPDVVEAIWAFIK